MSTPYLSEIRIMSFSFAPQGWALCNGQLLPISQNQALFTLLGTGYGGDGRTTFGLPDLRGNVPIHFGSGYTLGQRGGEVNHTLVTGEMPSHLHGANASTGTASVNSPVGAFLASSPGNDYTASSNGPLVTLATTAVATVGASQPHTNQQPFLTLSFCIAIQGIFPSQN